MQQYFGMIYQFSKYNYAFCPEFNSGAMENPGLVIMNNQLLEKDERGEMDDISLMDTIAHEMVHMWFGNVVTMQWWDDLWLNESFAEFFSYHALHESLPND